MIDTHTSLQPSTTREFIEMDDSSVARPPSRQRLLESQDQPPQAKLVGMARHTFGLILLLCVVFLWTLSNFLGSSIFADNTYAKPFFLTYLNTSMFMLAMIPTLLRSAYRNRKKHSNSSLYRTMRAAFSNKESYRPLYNGGSGMLDSEDAETESFIGPTKSITDREPEVAEKDKHLGIAATARLSLAFCFLWFGANYFAMACLQHTTVASTTILTSTSSFWTLLIGAFTGTEKFTWRKFCGVLGSLVGIMLISRVDLTKGGDDGVPLPPDDQFPDKPPSELALGDALALLSAIIYGVYTITLKQSTIKALPRSLNMPLFFGLVGTFNLILLFPMFPILHYTGLERFELPPTQWVWTILLTNSISSLFSDICWAYAMVLTSPLLVTVGLSLTIPLSLIGEMVLQGHYEGWLYWVGAFVVVSSFVFVDHEEREEEAGDANAPALSLPDDVESGDHTLDIGRADTGGVASPATASDATTVTDYPKRQGAAVGQSSEGQKVQGHRSLWDRLRSGGGSGGGGWASSDDNDDDDFLDSSDSD
ncbi:hypothetical protein A1O1_02594 [Capronia coronata CBS 617.96]|uniref:Uncharacterized protein n=1 Tax=Capronia coronata CBS 617.96 TaxID=1182541 RepID=W9YY40_9EURO|nr:uncharacterized protein A1O1_02594 [Capronia coronata CBS 617.96]EXJ94201.1 hypothetical protein A1O1_02594 [Capronia coronata CBS 617.96]